MLDSQNNERTIYSSVSEAARLIEGNSGTLNMAFKRKNEDYLYSDKPTAVTIYMKNKRYAITKLHA